MMYAMIFGQFLRALTDCSAERPIINPGLRFAVRLDARILHFELNFLYPVTAQSNAVPEWLNQLSVVLPARRPLLYPPARESTIVTLVSLVCQLLVTVFRAACRPLPVIL